MRLTVHHSSELSPYWLDSLNKLLAADNLNHEQLLHAGHWHVATFNDRIVGLAVTRDEELVYFAVRDVTRRRGIGHDLAHRDPGARSGAARDLLATDPRRPATRAARL